MNKIAGRTQHKLRGASHEFHTWVLSLPWVVERPSYGPGVRAFAVDCAPLHRRRIWLLTGLPQARARGTAVGISVILPDELSTHAVDAGWGTRVAALPAGHLLITLIDREGERPVDHVRKVASLAYISALSA